MVRDRGGNLEETNKYRLGEKKICGLDQERKRLVKMYRVVKNGLTYGRKNGKTKEQSVVERNERTGEKSKRNRAVPKLLKEGNKKTKLKHKWQELAVEI